MTDTRRWVVPLVLVGVVVAAAAATVAVWVGDGASSDDDPVAVPTGPPSADTIERAADSGVLITTSGCFGDGVGTGVVVTEGVVTNAHVIAGASAVTVTTPSGKVYEAEVRAFDPLKDLALLVAPGLDLAALDLGTPVGGAEAVAIVRQEGAIDVVSAEIARTINIFTPDIYGEGRHERKGMELRAEIDPGDSGGAIIDARGEVVGIVFSSSRRNVNVGYAVSAVELSELIASRSTTAVDNGECLP